MKKRFKTWMKDNENSMMDGVLSGFAKYVGVDVTFLRIGFLIFLFLSGFTAVIIYFLLSWLVVPDYRKSEDLKFNTNSNSKEDIVIKKKKSNSVIKNLVITDTIDNVEKTKNVKNIEVLPISGLMGEAIKRISDEKSVSSLFD